MRISLNGTLRAFVCILVSLPLTQQSLADGDQTNAQNITDPNLWSEMYQVMTGSSGTPASGSIRAPNGIYATVLVAGAVQRATALNMKNPAISTSTALTNFFSNIMSNPAVAGLVFVAPWSLLNPNGPTTPYEIYPPDAAYDWSSLDAAFTAAANLNKTIQIAIDPGFNSPGWVFNLMDALYGTAAPVSGSCDGLFTDPFTVPTHSCGYTDIFLTVEVTPATPKPFPLPWDPIYKQQWSTFLQALNQHIGSNTHFVSIAVAGPTAMSEEIMLPIARNQPATLTLGGFGVYSSSATQPYIDPNSAWNCLLAQNYGSNSAYINSDRAFIEEWAAAIDLYGQTFSGITLTISTANSLPIFSTSLMVNGCGISGITAPAGTPVVTAPPSFASACSASAAWPLGPAWPADCAAETAILAYFAEPPVGGANAKATQEDALAAWEINQINGGNMLTTANVKWLSANTAGGLMTLPGSVAGTTPVVSRMLGGSAFSGAFSAPDSAEGCPVQDPVTLAITCTLVAGGNKGCLTASLGCESLPSPEDALFNVLQAYFAGTNVAGNFGAPAGSYAPTNYLQIWWNDIAYAAGINSPHCTMDELMTTAPAPPATLACASPPTATTTSQVNGQYMTAQQLLETTANYITSAPVNVPLFGYNCPQNRFFQTMPTCNTGLVPRMAFNGDGVCVTPEHQSDAMNDNANAVSNFLENQSYPTKKPQFFYGECNSGLKWRQAYMGDYVCVGDKEREHVQKDNAERNFSCQHPHFFFLHKRHQTTQP